MRNLIVAGLLLALSGCANSQLGMFVQGDLANATALANAYGDSVAAACLGDLALATAPSAVPGNDGLFTLVQRKREIKATIQTGKCSPIAGELLLDIGERAPVIGPLVP